MLIAFEVFVRAVAKRRGGGRFASAPGNDFFLGKLNHFGKHTG